MSIYRNTFQVLDIDCGFGAFAKYAAKNYKVEVVGVTISEQQRLWAQESCRDCPVEIRFQDYRDVSDSLTGSSPSACSSMSVPGTIRSTWQRSSET
jgi:hypothetical protein